MCIWQMDWLLTHLYCCLLAIACCRHFRFEAPLQLSARQHPPMMPPPPPTPGRDSRRKPMAPPPAPPSRSAFQASPQSNNFRPHSAMPLGDSNRNMRLPGEQTGIFSRRPETPTHRAPFRPATATNDRFRPAYVDRPLTGFQPASNLYRNPF